MNKQEHHRIQIATECTLEQRIEALCESGGLPNFPDAPTGALPSIDSSPELTSCPDLSSWTEQVVNHLSVILPTHQSKHTHKHTQEHVATNRSQVVDRKEKADTPTPHTLEAWRPPQHPLI